MTSDALGWSPLHFASVQENQILVKKLLENGASVDQCDSFMRTALTIAAAKNNLPLVELLLQFGANPNQGFPLHYACEKGHSSIVSCLIDRGATVNLVKDDNYPILIAATYGFLDIVKILIENGAKVQVYNKVKESALQLACESCNVELICYLIKAGADIEARDKYDISPLTTCLIRLIDKPEFVRILLENGASPKIANCDGDTPLHCSLNPESTRLLIHYGADINAINSSQETPLYVASYFSHYDCCQVLLQHGANPNLVGPGGWSYLHYAAKEDDVGFVEKLIEYGANVNAASAQNVIPLHLAAFQGNLQIVSILLQKGSFIDIPVVDIADVNSRVPHMIDKECFALDATPLSLALAGNHLDVSKLLIASGADIANVKLPGEIALNTKKPMKKILDWPCSNLINNIRRQQPFELKSDFALIRDNLGWSVLHHSVFNECYEATVTLIDNGHPVDIEDNFHRTPLALASAHNNLKILELLLIKGANPNLGLPLHFATSQECIKKLVKYGCDLNISNKNDEESTALIEATINLKSVLVETLLECGADPNCVSKYGMSALHYANEEIAKLLIQHGANVNAVDSTGETPLLCAVLNQKNNDLVKVLIEKGAEINATNRFDNSALHLAVSCNYEFAVAELIQAGADINMINDDGEFPLYQAAEIENLSIVQMLLEHGALVNYTTDEGWSALHQSSFSGALDCVEELLMNGANVNVATAENVLPLYLAAIGGYYEIVGKLIEYGSLLNPIILDFGKIRMDVGINPLSERFMIKAGNNPLIGAATNGHVKIVEFLYSKGVSLELTNSQGNTALHEAAFSGAKATVEFLISKGCDIEKKNKKGKTVLDIAKSQSHQEICAILQDLKKIQ